VTTCRLICVPSILVVAFYFWLIAGGGFFVYRRVRGVPIRASRKSADKSTILADRAIASAPRPATAAFQTVNDTVDDSPVLGMPVHATVGELVTGIAMPCELVPYLGEMVDDRVVADRVVFSTVTSGMDSVVQGIQSELLRLGFSVSRPSEDQLVATGADGELDVRIAAPPVGGTHARYPDATAGAVIVELCTG
jgi:hypothetical protein